MRDKRKWLIGGAVAAVIPFLALAGIGYWLYDDVYATADRLDRIRFKATNEGLPIGPGDWSNGSALLASENAAEILIDISQEWQSLSPANRAEIEKAFSRKLDGDSQSVTRAKATGDKLIAGLVQASQRKGVDFRFNWERAEQIDFQIYSNLAAIAELGVQDSIIEGHAGNVTRSVSQLQSLAKLGSMISEGSTVDGLSAGTQIRTSVLTGLEQLVSDFPNEPAYRDALLATCTSQGAPSVMHSLSGEVMYLNCLVSRSEAYDDRTCRGALFKKAKGPTIDANATRMIEFWLDMMPRIESAAPDKLAIARAYAEGVDDYLANRSPSKLLVQSIVPYYQKPLDMVAAFGVRCKLAHIFLLVLDYHGKHKAYPDQLLDFTDEITDPCSGTALIYQKLPNGFRLYSVGRDGKDDIESSQSGRVSETDIMLELSNGQVTNSGR